MKRYRVHPSVCPSVCHSMDLQQQTRCCGPGRQEILIDCCSSGMRWVNALLTAYVGSWTQACFTHINSTIALTWIIMFTNRPSVAYMSSWNTLHFCEVHCLKCIPLHCWNVFVIYWIELLQLLLLPHMRCCWWINCFVTAWCCGRQFRKKYVMESIVGGLLFILLCTERMWRFSFNLSYNIFTWNVTGAISLCSVHRQIIIFAVDFWCVYEKFVCILFIY